MDKDTIVGLLFVICLVSFIVGVISHKKLIAEGGLPGLFIRPAEQLTQSARKAKKWMFGGYGMFIGSIALMLAISSIWGPVKG